MRALSSTDILRIWESGARQHPLDRALTVLAAAGERRADLAHLPIGERDRRLWEVRETTFGPIVESLTQCPTCRERVEFQFRVADVRVASAEATAREHELNVGEWAIRFRLPDSQDLAALVTANDCGHVEAELASRCLLRSEWNGTEVAPAEVPADAWERVQRRMSDLDPQAEVRFELSCPACGHRWQTLFDIAQFLWTEVAAIAEQLLREVDLLARAYGWSEGAILSLSPDRRQAYLELARS